MMAEFVLMILLFIKRIFLFFFNSPVGGVIPSFQKILVLVALTGIIPLSADFYAEGYGEFGAEYLKLPRHARGAGLAYAVTAWRGNASATQFNPALAAEVGQLTMLGTYTHLSLERKYNGLSFIQPILGIYALEISLTSFGVKDIPEITENEDGLSGTRTERLFNNNEMSMELALSGKMGKYLTFGLRGRYLHQAIGDFSDGKASGLGFDAGILYAPVERLSLGLSGLNLGSVLWWENGRKDWVAATVRGGICLQIIKQTLVTELDIIKPLEQPLEGALGIEGSILNVLSLRAGGLCALDHIRGSWEFWQFQPYFGLGVSYSYFSIDYAAMNPWSVFGIGHKFTLSLGF